jgi:hypothetical protein
MKFKELIKTRLMPRIDIDGDRFTITPRSDDGGVIDGEVIEQNAMVPLRRDTAAPEQPEPRVGRIPKHSWGS